MTARPRWLAAETVGGVLEEEDIVSGQEEEEEEKVMRDGLGRREGMRPSTNLAVIPPGKTTMATRQPNA